MNVNPNWESMSIQQATFMVIDGSVNRKTLQEQLKIVNSAENANGESIKIILGPLLLPKD